MSESWEVVNTKQKKKQKEKDRQDKKQQEKMERKKQEELEEMRKQQEKERFFQTYVAAKPPGTQKLHIDLFYFCTMLKSASSCKRKFQLMPLMLWHCCSTFICKL